VALNSGSTQGLIVIKNRPVDTAQDDVIFSAKYSVGRVSASLIICFLLIYVWRGVTYGIAQDIYEGIAIGGQGLLHFLLLGSIMLLLLLPILPFVLNPLFLKKLSSSRIEFK